MLTDTNKNSTENHAHGYSQFRLKVRREALLTYHVSIFIPPPPRNAHPHMTSFCQLICSKFLQHHAAFYYRALLETPLSAAAQIASCYLTNCCCVNAYQMSPGCQTSFNVTLSKYTHANSQEFHLIFPVSSSHSTWSRFGLNPAAGRLCSAPAHQPARLTEFYSAAQKGIGIWNLTQCINRGTAMTTHTFINVNVIQDIQ